MNKVPRVIWLALAASVALNTFALGVFAARHFGPRERSGRDVGPRAFMHQSGLRKAGPEVQAILREHKGEIRERMHALRDARKQVREALKAEPYDPARAEAAFAQMRERNALMQTDMHAVLSELAKQLNREQRARMADALWHTRSDVQAP